MKLTIQSPAIATDHEGNTWVKVGNGQGDHRWIKAMKSATLTTAATPTARKEPK